jgi:radical SAM superfamily enzyme YgiQ (UPF0313 family)
VTPTIVEMLLSAGCCRIQIGVESADLTVLKRIGKQLSPAASGRAVEMCRAQGLPVKAMLMWGLPGDGPESALRIIEWTSEFQPDYVQLAMFVPLPGSPLWKAGYHLELADYRRASFFPSPGTPAGIRNDRCSAAELLALYDHIVAECELFTQIDRGQDVTRS